MTSLRVGLVGCGLLSIGISVGCGSAGEEPDVGLRRSALVNLTVIAVSVDTAMEGTSISLTGGDATVVAENISHVEVRWGEINPSTGTQFITVVCDASGTPATCGALNSTCDGQAHTFRDSLDTNGGTAGDHTIVCAADGDGGGGATQQDTVTINEVGTTVDASNANPNTYAVEEDTALTTTGTFTDPAIDTVPNPDVLYESYNCTWVWGDGTPNTVIDPCTPSTVNTSHTYVNSGTFSGELRVDNEDSDGGGIFNSAFDVVVSDHEPFIGEISSTPTTSIERQSTSFSALVTASAQEPVVSCSWDWGDGNSENEPDCPGNGTNITVSATHTYADGDPSTKTITLSVTDTDGTVTKTKMQTINNAAAVVTAPTSSSTLKEGSTITYNSSFVDSPDADWLTEWDFNYTGVFTADSSLAVTTSGAISSFTVYNTQGTYTVVVRVTDQTAAGIPGPNSMVGSNSAMFVIADVDPTITGLTHTDGGAPANPNEGSTVTFKANIASGAADGTSDPIRTTDGCKWDPDGTGPIAEQSFNFGTAQCGGSGGAFNSVFTFAYDDNRTAISAKLTVFDEDSSASATDGPFNVLNVSPTITITADTLDPSNEGADVTVTYTVSDPASVSNEIKKVTINWGDGTVETVCDDDGGTAPPACTEGAGQTFGPHAYEDDTEDLDGSVDLCGGASCTITMSVDDKDGGSGSDTEDHEVRNVLPFITDVTVSSPVPEGQAVSVFIEADDVADLDTLTYSIDFMGDGTCSAAAGDVCNSTLPGGSFVYGDESSTQPGGDYSMIITVCDDDNLSIAGGCVSLGKDAIVTDNPPDIITLVNTSPKNEAQTVTASIEINTVKGDTYTISYDWGDGTSPDTGCGRSCTHTYADDDADDTYILTVTVTDDEGGTDNATNSVTILNVPPVGSASNGGPVNEGTSVSISGVLVTDVAADTASLRCFYDFENDGTFGATPTAVAGGTCATSNTFADNGEKTVAIRLDDQDGGTTVVTTTVVVNNVAPSFVAPTGTNCNAVADGTGGAYDCDLDATDPGSDTLTFTLLTGPTGMTVGAADGVIAWTPTADQTRSSHTFTVRVSDDDGGSASFTRTVTSYLDTDADGMSDLWEDANGTDKSDPADSSADSDNDGMSNIEEFAAGTDPFTFDGPTQAVALSPVGGTEVTSATPTLRIRNATDPNGNTLTYSFEVYDNAALSGSAVYSVGSVAQGTIALTGGGTATDHTTGALPDNKRFYWRARAHDGEAFGAFTEVGTFFVNVANDAPSSPTLSAPSTGSEVASLFPMLQVGNSTDLDLDVLTYKFEVATTTAFGVAIVTSALTVAEGGGGMTSWTVAEALSDNTPYYWRARANDGTVDGGNTSVGRFFVNTSNDPPSPVALTAPDDGEEVETRTPTLSVANATDSDGDVLTYDFEIDVSAAFNAAVGGNEEQTSNETSFVSPQLDDNTWYFWRARANDGSAAGDWATRRFFVNTENDPPNSPVAQNPSSGSAVDRGSVVLTVRNTTDPDGDELAYTFTIYSDADLSDVHETIEEVPEGEDGQTSAVPTKKLAAGKSYYWTAMAVDDEGEPSEPSPAFEFRTFGAVGSGCAVARADTGRRAGASGGSAGAVALLALAPLGVAMSAWRRRKRESAGG